MKSATQERYCPDRPYPKQALAIPTIPKHWDWPDRADFGHQWPDGTDFGHHWPDWPDIVQTIGQTEQTLGQTVVQTIRQTVVQTNGQNEQTLGQTIVQTVGQTIRQTVVQTIGQTKQILGQTISQTHLNVYKHPIKFLIYSFQFLNDKWIWDFKKKLLKKTVDLKTNANFKRKLMKYSNHLKVDVVYHL